MKTTFLTIRIEKTTKEFLREHCHQRSIAEGKDVSTSALVQELIYAYESRVKDKEDVNNN